MFKMTRYMIFVQPLNNSIWYSHYFLSINFWRMKKKRKMRLSCKLSQIVLSIIIQMIFFWCNYSNNYYPNRKWVMVYVYNHFVSKTLKPRYFKMDDVRYPLCILHWYLLDTSRYVSVEYPKIKFYFCLKIIIRYF